MKLPVLFTLVLLSFTKSQSTKDSIHIIEINLTEYSNIAIQDYLKKLDKNNINLSYNIVFNGSYTKNNNHSNFNGKASYKNNLFIKNFSLHNIDDDNDKEIIYKLFNQIYRTIFSYYSFAINKQNDISKNFYCYPMEQNKWLFKVLKNSYKEEYLNINSSNKMNFIVQLNPIGQITNIQTYMDSEKNFIRNNKISASYDIMINFATHNNKISLSSADGKVFIPSTDSTINFQISFK